MALNKKEMLEELYSAYEFFQKAEETEYICETKMNLLEEERTALKKTPWVIRLVIGFALVLFARAVTSFIQIENAETMLMIYSIIPIGMFILGCILADKIYPQTPIYANKVKQLEEREAEVEDWRGKVLLDCMNQRGQVSFLSDRYWNTQAIGKMISYLEGNRANTVAQMVNLYEKEMHYQRMEDLQEEILREEKLQTEAAQQPEYIYIYRD